MTSLVGTSLLAAGNTPLEGRYSSHVQRAVEYVLSCARSDGLISRPEEEMRPMYGHGFAMLFLAQAHGMERDLAKQLHIRRVLQRAVQLTARSQSDAGGWIYTPDARGDEGSVTVTQIQGLRAIRDVGVKVPRVIIDRACHYIHKSANPDGGIRYRMSTPGASRPAITAAAVATLYSAGQYEHPVAHGALEYVRKLVKSSKSGGMIGGHRFYSILYTAQAMYMSSEEDWLVYFPKLRNDLLTSQTENGSWNDNAVGHTYATAIALIVLQLPYGYLPILQR